MIYGDNTKGGRNNDKAEDLPLACAVCPGAEWHRQRAEAWKHEAIERQQKAEGWADKAEAATKESEKWKYHAEHWQHIAEQWLQIAHSLSEKNVMLLQLFDYKPPVDLLTDEQADRIKRAMEEAPPSSKTPGKQDY